MDSVRQLMRGLIDYAGMFPPARLPLESAFANYFDYRRTAIGQWILKYFLCPARDLSALSTLWESESADLPLLVSAVGGGGQDLSEFLSAAGEDFKAVEGASCGQRPLQVKLIELKIPASLCTAAQMGAFHELLIQTAGLAETRKCAELSPYYEISFAADWADAVPQCIRAVADFNQGWSGSPGFRRCGVKIRTGGVAAEQFPSVEQVALWIESCSREGVAFKATAGLHHPFRHFSTETNCKMHGFVNVFLAAALAHSRRAEGGVDHALLSNILNEERPEAFSAKPEGMEWNGLLITNGQIESTRRDFAHSYGSCSFLEPVQDLQRMGWLLR